MQQPANPQPQTLTPQHVAQIDEYVKKSLQFVDTQLHNELREFYKPIRKMLMQLALPEPEIRYREKIIEVESLTQKKEIDRLKYQLAQAQQMRGNPFADIITPEASRAASILRAITTQPDLF